jgi:hypothetical protein
MSTQSKPRAARRPPGSAGLGHRTAEPRDRASSEGSTLPGKRRISVGMRVALFLGCAWAVGCVGGGLPPLMRDAPATPVPSGAARVVVVWEPTSCDSAGDYAIATPNAFLGFIRTGTRLEADLPPGQHTLFVWSRDRAPQAARTVGVLHADLRPQRSYVAALSFGDWDERGPQSAFVRRTATRVCADREPELVRRGPGEAKSAPAIRALTLDGQMSASWTSEHRVELGRQAALAEERFELLTPDAKALATVEPADGAELSP